MHNTISDIALTNVSRETFLLFCVAPKQKFFVFPQPREYVSSMFLNSGHLQPHVLVKRVLIKKSMYIILVQHRLVMTSRSVFNQQMRIHAPSPYKLSQSKSSDYFFNYFTLGMVSWRIVLKNARNIVLRNR